MTGDLTRARGTPRCTPEELALLARFRAGDGTTYQTLVRPHLGALLGLSRRLVGDRQWAEDLAQETLVRAFKGLAGFRGECSLRTWLFRIAARLASEPERWRGSDAAVRLANLEIPDHVGPAPEQPTAQRELRDRLAEAMERLPARQRTALHLRAVEGLDYEGIAAVLSCSRGAARMLVLAARRRVMERMGSYLLP